MTTPEELGYHENKHIHILSKAYTKFNGKCFMNIVFDIYQQKYISLGINYQTHVFYTQKEIDEIANARITLQQEEIDELSKARITLRQDLKKLNKNNYETL